MNSFILTLIKNLEVLGVRLRASQAHIMWEAPPGVMTASIMAFLKKFKFQVISLLHLREQERYLQSIINKTVLGDCLLVLSKIASNCIDLFLFDPPYGIDHLGLAWDSGLVSIEILKEIYRTAKPGAFIFCFTSYRQDVMSEMIGKLKAVGFVVTFSSFSWIYLNGRPKGLRVDNGVYTGIHPRTSAEFILVAMKPIEELNHLEQMRSNGKGVSYMGDCRIPRTDKILKYKGSGKQGHSEGRFPSNILVSDQALGESSKYFDVDLWFEKFRENLPHEAKRTFPHLVVPKPVLAEKDAGLESFEAKVIVDGKGNPITDSFQHSTKPRKNIHPTVKPIKILAFLMVMGSRQGNIVCDPFCGSGSTCVTAKLLGRKFIGIEREEEYQRIAEARSEHASLDVPVLNQAVAEIKKYEESREKQQKDDRSAKTPEPCFFSNMPDAYWDELLKKN